MSLFKRNTTQLPRERRRPDFRAGSTQPSRQAPTANPNPAFSYYAARSQSEFNVGRVAQSDQPIRKQPKPLQRLLVGHRRTILAGIILMFALLYNLQLSTTPKVVALSTEANAPFLRDSTIYQQAAETLFKGSAANRNKLTVNASAISDKLKQQFPELRDVSIALPLLGSRPTVYVQPSRPAAVLTSSSGTFVLDENGRALVAASVATDLARFKVPAVIDQSRLPIKVGQPAIARSTAEFIRTVNEQLGSKGIAISRVVLPADAYELDVYVSGKAKPYFVKFNLRDNSSTAAETQTGTYLASAQYLEGKGIAPGSYIDVRIAGRAYYK